MPSDLSILQNLTLEYAFASVEPSTSMHTQHSEAQDVALLRMRTQQRRWHHQLSLRTVRENGVNHNVA
jgi:hypothetical protein